MGKYAKRLRAGLVLVPITVLTTASTAFAMDISGTPGNDRIRGTSSADNISAGAGNDRVRGLGGNDIVNGEAGRDRLFGNAGDDRLNGLAGADRLYGNAGDDTLRGDTPNAGDLISRDRLFGGRGNDQLFGGDGRDRLHGGGGNDSSEGQGGRDLMSGGTGDDTQRGGAGDDLIFANLGVDTTYGGEGDDRLWALARGDVPLPGVDSLRGEGGNDRFFTRDGEADVISCGEGDDVALLDTADVIEDATAENANGSCEKVVRAAPKVKEARSEDAVQSPGEDGKQQ